MLFRMLPRNLHEIFGVFLPLLVLRHLWLNRAWFKTFAKGGQTPPRILSTGINWLLVLSFIVIVITGIFLSRHLFRGFIPMYLHRNMAVHVLHAALPYYFLILAGLHIGFHWRGIAAKIPFAPLHGKCGRFLSYIAVLFGVYGSFAIKMGDRLLLKHVVGTPASSLPPPLYALIIISVISLYAVLAHCLLTFWQKKHSQV